MKTVTANNYRQAFKELEALDKSVAQQLQDEIPENDRGHYVVALVKQTNNAIERRYDTTFNIQQFDRKAFDKVQANYQTLGYDKVIVLHTPESNQVSVVDTTSSTPGTSAPVITQADIDAAKAQAREEARREFEAEQSKKEQEDAANTLKEYRATRNYQFAKKDGFDVENEKTTVAEIHEFAKKHNIDFSPESSKKADFVADVTKWLEQETPGTSAQ